jgi:lipoate-protein ligase A
LCFSFILPHNHNIDFKGLNTQVIIKSLANLGIPAEASGRNDIIVEGRKISGSAFKINLANKKYGPKCLHHGTILINVDLEKMQKFLNPNKLKLISKGVDSVRSRVMNLNEKFPHINKEMICGEIQKEFLKFYNAEDKYDTIELENEKACRIEKINELFRYYNSWEWKFGECPEFTNSLAHKFDWGLIDLCLRVEKGIIVESVVFSDCLVTEFIDYLNSALLSLKSRFNYDVNGINNLFDELILNYEVFKENKEYINFLVEMKRELVKNI